MYCKHCKEKLSSGTTVHYCEKKGLLDVSAGDSFLVSALIGYATDSAILGAALGGDITGGIVGDLLDGDLFD